MKSLVSRLYKNWPTKYLVPAIALDIDGVLKRGDTVIFDAPQAIKLLKTPLSQFSSRFKGINTGLPMVFVTNSGGHLESEKAQELNQLLGLNKQSERINPEEIILSHTPLREIAHNYIDKYVIVSGMGDVLNVALNYGFNKVITIDEYSAMFPYLSRLSLFETQKEEVKRIASKAKRRLGFPEGMKIPPPISGFFLFSQPVVWERNLQICCDLLISRDGIPGSIRRPGEKQFVKLYITNPDHYFMDAFSLPRLAEGSYLVCLQELFKRQYGVPIEMIQYGKPMPQTFKFAEKVLRKQYKENFDFSSYYMIGDSPEGDIKGANACHWKSFLVKTGLFKGPENDPDYPATYIENDVLESVKHILRLERIMN